MSQVSEYAYSIAIITQLCQYIGFELINQHTCEAVAGGICLSRHLCKRNSVHPALDGGQHFPKNNSIVTSSALNWVSWISRLPCQHCSLQSKSTNPDQISTHLLLEQQLCQRERLLTCCHADCVTRLPVQHLLLIHCLTLLVSPLQLGRCALKAAKQSIQIRPLTCTCIYR